MYVVTFHNWAVCFLDIEKLFSYQTVETNAHQEKYSLLKSMVVLFSPHSWPLNVFSPFSWKKNHNAIATSKSPWPHCGQFIGKVTFCSILLFKYDFSIWQIFDFLFTLPFQPDRILQLKFLQNGAKIFLNCHMYHL